MPSPRPDETKSLSLVMSFRHPSEELSFFGVQPTSTVVEVWPGGGYWTQILAPLLRDHGVYYAAFGPADGDREERGFSIGPDFQHMLKKIQRSTARRR